MSRLTGCCFSGLDERLDVCDPRRWSGDDADWLRPWPWLEPVDGEWPVDGSRVAGAALETGNVRPDDEREYASGVGASPCLTAGRNVVGLGNTGGGAEVVDEPAGALGPEGLRNIGGLVATAGGLLLTLALRDSSVNAGLSGESCRLDGPCVSDS